MLEVNNHMLRQVDCQMATSESAIYRSEAMQENIRPVYGSHARSEWSTSYVVHSGKSIVIARSCEKLI